MSLINGLFGRVYCFVCRLGVTQRADDDCDIVSFVHSSSVIVSRRRLGLIRVRRLLQCLSYIAAPLSNVTLSVSRKELHVLY